jgi:hypothetical protein
MFKGERKPQVLCLENGGWASAVSSPGLRGIYEPYYKLGEEAAKEILSLAEMDAPKFRTVVIPAEPFAEIQPRLAFALRDDAGEAQRDLSFYIAALGRVGFVFQRGEPRIRGGVPEGGSRA